MAELVTFAVPTGSDKTLLVWELSSGPMAEAFILCSQSSPSLAFCIRSESSQTQQWPVLDFMPSSSFIQRGMLTEPKRHATRSSFSRNLQWRFRLGTQHKVVQHNALALNSSRCQELANYYFGFNGWSKRIIKVSSRFSLTNQAPFNIELLDFRKKTRTGLQGGNGKDFPVEVSEHGHAT